MGYLSILSDRRRERLYKDYDDDDGRRRAGVNWSAYWADRLPYFALPETGVSLLVGQEVTIYGDSLIAIPIGNPLKVTYTCDIGTQVDNNFVLEPEIGDVGRHTLRILFENGNYKIADETISLDVFAVATTGTKKILAIGDSVTYGGLSTFAPEIANIIPGATLSYIGTILNDGYLSEARNGWNFHMYITNALSPFVKDGVLNIPSYFVDNSIDTPNYVFIKLGIGDTLMYSDHLITEEELAYTLSTAKTLIDAILEYDAGIRIIVSIPTICENTGTGWAVSMIDNPTYDQNNYISNIHRQWVSFTTAFANGVYDERVDCAYDSIFLNRSNYWKENGVIVDALHPDGAGRLELAGGIASHFNYLIVSDNIKPSALSVIWTNDYAAISFTDNSGGAAQHEIWESVNGGAYTLVTTLNAATVTYNSYTYQNATVIFRVRAKLGNIYSGSLEETLVTPLVLTTNQSTIQEVKFLTLNIAADKTINVDWGDGTNQNITGNNTNVVKTYSETANPYYIKITGDTNSIVYLRLAAQTFFSGNISKWVKPTSLTRLAAGGSGLSGDIGWWNLSGMDRLYLNYTSMSFDASDLIVPATMDLYWLLGTTVSGSLPDIEDHASRGLDYNLSGCRFNGTGITTFRKAMSVFNIGDQAVAFPTSEIDKLLKAIADFYESNAPLANCTFTMTGANMGIPTGGTSNIDKLRIEAAYTAAGKTGTVNVRTS